MAELTVCLKEVQQKGGDCLAVLVFSLDPTFKPHSAATWLRCRCWSEESTFNLSTTNFMFVDHISSSNANIQRVWAVINQWIITKNLNISGFSMGFPNYLVFHGIWSRVPNLEVPVTWWISLCPVTALQTPLEEDTLRLLPNPAATCWTNFGQNMDN